MDNGFLLLRKKRNDIFCNLLDITNIPFSSRNTSENSWD